MTQKLRYYAWLNASTSPSILRELSLVVAANNHDIIIAVTDLILVSKDVGSRVCSVWICFGIVVHGAISFVGYQVLVHEHAQAAHAVAAEDAEDVTLVAGEFLGGFAAELGYVVSEESSDAGEGQVG